MMKPICFSGIALVLIACEPQATKMENALAHEEAVKLCTDKAIKYARYPAPVKDADGFIQIGVEAKKPDEQMISDFYRSCYHSNTGIWPTSTVKITFAG